MIQWFCGLSHPAQAFLATLFTWALTAAGAAPVFLFRKFNQNVLDAMLGFAGGVMVAASFWSLLSPAIEMAETLQMVPWLVVLCGFLGGGLLLFAGDRLCSRPGRARTCGKGGPGGPGAENRGPVPAALLCRKRSLMLVASITLHNIPEGMAVGVAFGSLAYDLEGASLGAACLLALGIGLQNFPEGTAVALPLLREGAGRKKAFFWGQLSGLAEPAAGVLGALLAVQVSAVLPFLLAFAAGAMIYVVAQELLPESGGCGLWMLAGFALMMILDVALG